MDNRAFDSHPTTNDLFGVLGRVVSYPALDIETNRNTDIKITCDFHLTDTGNAQRLVTDCGDNIRYCAAKKQWYIWDSIRWALDTTNVIREIAKQRVQFIHAEAAFAIGSDNQERSSLQKDIQKWAFQSESEKHLKAMIKLAESDPRIVIQPEEFDSNPHLINCLKGTIDLDNCTREEPMREHRREDFITKLCPTPYDRNACGEQWYNSLLEVLPPRLGAFLQRVMGYAITGEYQEKAFFLFFGKANARKSTLLEPIVKTFGDYVKPLDASFFSKRKLQAGRPQPHIISLEGKRAGYCEELPKGMVLDDAFIKRYSSGGKGTARGLYESYERDIESTAVLLIETNDRPVIDFDDTGMFDRVYIIPFLNRIPTEEKKAAVKKRLLEDEEEQRAIFAWVIEGAFEYLENGLQPPEDVMAQKVEYQKAMNPLAWFVTDCCIEREDVWTSTEALFERFVSVIKELPVTTQREMRKEVSSAKSFAKYFAQFGFKVERRYDESKTQKRGFAGVELPCEWEGPDSDYEEADDQQDIKTFKKAYFNKPSCNVEYYMRYVKNTDSKCLTPCSEGDLGLEMRASRVACYGAVIDARSEETSLFENRKEKSTEDSSLKDAEAPFNIPSCTHGSSDRVELVKAIRDIVISWREAQSTQDALKVNRTHFINLVAATVRRQHPEWAGRDIEGEIVLLGESDAEIQALLADLTQAET